MASHLEQNLPTSRIPNINLFIRASGTDQSPILTPRDSQQIPIKPVGSALENFDASAADNKRSYIPAPDRLVH